MKLLKQRRWRNEFLIAFSGISAPFFMVFGILLPFIIIFTLATRMFFLAFLLMPFLILLFISFSVAAYTETSKKIELENKELINEIKGNYSKNVKNK